MGIMGMHCMEMGVVSIYQN